MEKNTKSKTHREIFEEEYPFDVISHNPLKATEAYGYLECLKQFLPSYAWIDLYKLKLIIVLTSIADEGIINHE